MSIPKIEQALKYASWGLSVISIDAGAKFDKRSWKRYQEQPAGPRKLRGWFEQSPDRNIGIIFGAVSSGLGARDFDRMDAYNAWAKAHPTLATRLPTVITGRGRHVYFRTTEQHIDAVRAIVGKHDGNGAFEFDDGELRITSGCYCLAPPSIHPDGHVYQWQKEPFGLGAFLAVDPIQAGFVPCDTVYTEDSGHKGCPASTEAAGSTASTVSHRIDQADRPGAPKAPRPGPAGDKRVELAIERSLPTKKGERHQMLFRLARELKAIEFLADEPIGTLRPIIEQWHLAALKTINTKPFEESWLDFAEGWANVKFPAGKGPVDLAFAKALEANSPACASRYEQPAVRQLVRLCRELQIVAGEKPFFLSARTAAALFELDHHATAARWLKLLQLDRVISLVSAGSKASREASTYFYIGGN